MDVFTERKIIDNKEINNKKISIPSPSLNHSEVRPDVLQKDLGDRACHKNLIGQIVGSPNTQKRASGSEA